MFAWLKSKTISEDNKSVIFDFVKGLLASILISFALIVLFAFILKCFDISDVAIVPSTLLIKGISVFVGSIIAIKGKDKGLIKGAVFGAIYVVFAFFIFGIIAANFTFDLGLILDFAFAVLLGSIVGIVKVNRN